MRQIIQFLLIVILPTGLYSSKTSDYLSRVSGVYFDRYSDTEILIKPHRKGIKAKVNGSKWRTYNYRGQGLYDDCNGRLIFDIGYGQIQYQRRSRRNLITLEQYGGNEDRYFYDRDRDSQRAYGRSSSYRSGIDRFRGSWQSTNRGLSLSIELFGKGFRARRPNQEWVYYDRYNNNEYRDRSGNRCYFEGNDLIWGARDGRRSFRFRRG
ncbi:MAG: hypothetical protein ACI9FN_000265 [Saprospiraceae bacterium]|jgi:hypothetical protein